MALVTRFDTPASLRDLPAGSAFYDDWHAFLAAGLVTTAGSGTATGEFYDASEVNVDVLAERPLVWMGFPRRVLLPSRRDDRAGAYMTADTTANRAVQDEYCEWFVKRTDPPRARCSARQSR